MWTNFGKLVRYFVLTVSVLGVAVVVFGLYIMLRPQGSLGEASDNCVREDFPAVPNGSGMVATSHTVSCDYFIAHGEETTFIYLHKLGANDSRKSLIFRFGNADNNFDNPQLIWSDNLNLHISISEVGEVTKEIGSTDGVKISYSIGKEDSPAGESDKIRRRIAAVLFVVLILLTAICVVTTRSIQKQKYKTIWMTFDVPKS